MPESPGIDFERIRHLARLAKELGLSELTSEENGVKVEITVTPTAPVAMGIPSVGAPPPWGGHSAPRRAKPATPEEQGLVAVRSPVMGVFYRAASPETPPYVEVGARVEEGDIVGLVEAMKVFNEIASEVTGEVVEVVAKNGDLVELDQPLVWLRP
ncbi:MAG: acetyl-CoA carboxylase biotin carboxyl carrier protein [Armatimonadetes bacterium]|jgi:acetyl-CoA carboxylase biotin carboxyl carrier protein|nr:acetyl-CoA carboxylase biotin carboxyl carrier protein [Armatimonadota bacterium]MDI9600557.1 acetyl-CoA carboxylase biotin carboxyl carrier protein [Acidobacteriota bacterium]NLN90870.1 acetyl-CoA carboxylase biotin carboxyl carrier protein [candidate division WS1 bacterium]